MLQFCFMALTIPDNKRLGDRIESLEKEARSWGRITRKKLLLRLLQLGIDDKIKLAKTQARLRKSTDRSGKTSLIKEEFLTKSLGSRIRKKQGDLEAVAFSFSRHGIFLEHGVGKHRPKGSSAASRAAKPWLEPVLSSSIDDLANILENEYADLAAETLRFNIPGVIDSTIKISN